LPAGDETGRHRHAYSTMIYVLEGRFRFEEGEHGETVPEHKAGSIFSDRAGTAVNGRALAPTKLLVVSTRESGRPESLPACSRRPGS
jgi:quercetin dioxygenase-like cupin family protein